MCKPVQVTHTTDSQVVKGVPSFHPTEAVLLSYASAVVETSACERKVKLDDLVIACVEGHGHHEVWGNFTSVLVVMFYFSEAHARFDQLGVS